MPIISLILITFQQVNGSNINPNNNSAEVYDIIYDSLKPINITEAEISIITSKLEPGSKILDIGGGTGRHAIILAELGYDVTVIDSSSEMLKNLQKKADKKGLKIKVINQDIFEIKLEKNEFDMGVLFWNSFNEIALNKKHALKLLNLLKNTLKKNGSIILNIDDSKKIDPSSFNFSAYKILKNKEYKVNWKTVEYHKSSNTSISKEEITITDKLNNTSQTLESFIKQRYWSLEEVRELCNKLDLRVKKLNFKQSGELYLEIY